MKITLLVIAIVLLALLVVIAMACLVAALAREKEWRKMVDDEYYRINNGKEKNQ